MQIVEQSVAKVTMISHQFKKVAPAMRRSAAGRFVNSPRTHIVMVRAGSPDQWPGAVDVLTGNSINLMKAIQELLRATEIVSKGFVLCCVILPVANHIFHTEVSLKSLLLIKSQGKHCRLVNLVSAKWESFGIRQDSPLNQLEGWKVEFLGDVAKCWVKVMEHWLSGGGLPDYPATWDSLYLLLDGGRGMHTSGREAQEVHCHPENFFVDIT